MQVQSYWTRWIWAHVSFHLADTSVSRPVQTDFRPMSGQSSVNAVFLWCSVSQGVVLGEPHSGPRVDMVKVSCFKRSIVWRVSPVQIWSHASHVSLLWLVVRLIASGLEVHSGLHYSNKICLLLINPDSVTGKPFFLRTFVTRVPIFPCLKRGT